MASTILQPVIACIARTCGMSAVCWLTVVGMSKVILRWTDGCIIMGAEEPDSSSHLRHWQVESCHHIKKGFVLDFLGITEAPWEDMEKEVTMFMIAAYGGLGMTMSKCHK